MQRAGKETVNSLYGTRVAVLAGDFLFAESSAGLAQLDNLEVSFSLLLIAAASRSRRCVTLLAVPWFEVDPMGFGIANSH
jgi:geranylgeranyl pyrophosphate synthase